MPHRRKKKSRGGRKRTGSAPASPPPSTSPPAAAARSRSPSPAQARPRASSAPAQISHNVAGGPTTQRRITPHQGPQQTLQQLPERYIPSRLAQAPTPPQRPDRHQRTPHRTYEQRSAARPPRSKAAPPLHSQSTRRLTVTTDADRQGKPSYVDQMGEVELGPVNADFSPYKWRGLSQKAPVAAFRENRIESDQKLHPVDQQALRGEMPPGAPTITWNETIALLGHHESSWRSLFRENKIRLRTTKNNAMESTFFDGYIRAQDLPARPDGSYLVVRTLFGKTKLYGAIVFQHSAQIVGQIAPDLQAPTPCVLVRNVQGFNCGGIVYNAKGEGELISQDQCQQTLRQYTHNANYRIFLVSQRGQMFVKKNLLQWSTTRPEDNLLIVIGSGGFVVLPISDNLTVLWRRFQVPRYSVTPIRSTSQLRTTHRFFVVRNGALIPNITTVSQMSLELYTRDSGALMDSLLLAGIVSGQWQYNAFMQRDFQADAAYLNMPEYQAFQFNTANLQTYWEPYIYVYHHLEEGNLNSYVRRSEQLTDRTVPVGPVITVHIGQIQELMRVCADQIDRTFARGTHLVWYNPIGRLIVIVWHAQNSQQNPLATIGFPVGHVERVLPSFITEGQKAVGVEFAFTGGQQVYNKEYCFQDHYVFANRVTGEASRGIIAGKDSYLTVSDNYPSSRVSYMTKIGTKIDLVTENCFMVAWGVRRIRYCHPYFCETRQSIIPSAVCILPAGFHSVVFIKDTKGQSHNITNSFYMSFFAGTSQIPHFEPTLLFGDLSNP